MRNVARLFVVVVFVTVEVVLPVTPGALDLDANPSGAAVAPSIPARPAASDDLDADPPYSRAVYLAALDWWAWHVAVRDRALELLADAEQARDTAPARGVTTGTGSGDASGDCTAGGGGASPVPDYIVQRESGGDYCAVNSSSGAFGRYQIMPSTWAGACADLARTPDGQDACASRLVASSGLAPWGE